MMKNQNAGEEGNERRKMGGGNGHGKLLSER